MINDISLIILGAVGVLVSGCCLFVALWLCYALEMGFF